jgi:hypothetical protein
VNALGLLTRESSTRRRQASDTSSLRSIGLEGQTSGSVSTSYVFLVRFFFAEQNADQIVCFLA